MGSLGVSKAMLCKSFASLRPAYGKLDVRAARGPYPAASTKQPRRVLGARLVPDSDRQPQIVTQTYGKT